MTVQVLVLLFTIVCAVHGQSQYQKAVSFSSGYNTVFQLWTLPGMSSTNPPKGLLLYFPANKYTTIQTNFASTETYWRAIVALATRFNFAIVTSGYYNQTVNNVQTIAGISMFDNGINYISFYDPMKTTIDSLVTTAGYSSRSGKLPWIAYGISGGGGMSARFGLYFSTRTIAFAHDKGASINNVNTADVLAGVISSTTFSKVPGIITLGNVDVNVYPSNTVIDSTVDAWNNNFRTLSTTPYPSAIFTFNLDNGVQHSGLGYGLFASIMYLSEVIPLRFPTWATYSFSTAPTLTLLPYSNSWLGKVYLGPTYGWLNYTNPDCCDWYHYVNTTVSFNSTIGKGPNTHWIPNSLLARLWVSSSTTKKQAVAYCNGQKERNLIYVTAGTSITVNATQSLTIGESITSIQWYVGETALGSPVTTSPYVVTYTAAKDSTGKLTFRAIYGTVYLTNSKISTTGYCLIAVS